MTYSKGATKPRLIKQEMVDGVRANDERQAMKFGKRRNWWRDNQVIGVARCHTDGQRRKAEHAFVKRDIQLGEMEALPIGD